MFLHQRTCMNVSACCTTQKTQENMQKLRKLETRQLETSLLETQVSKGIRNMKETSETSENIRNMAELLVVWKSKRHQQVSNLLSHFFTLFSLLRYCNKSKRKS
jgi:hypothetical protein